jgi:U3 small nucleolar RNA-associated protein 14
MKFKNGLAGFFSILLFFFIAMQICAPKYSSVLTEESESETESNKQIESEFILISLSTIENIKEEIISKSKNNYKKYQTSFKNNLIRAIQYPPPECL